MKILITGGAGYIGSIMCQKLLEVGHQVTVLDKLIYGEANLFNLCSNRDFEFIYGDARDETALAPLVKGADVLIPLAAIVGAPACDRDPWLARSVNLEAIELLNRIRSLDQLMVFPTTNSGYGQQLPDLVCTEQTPLEPISIYGQTKVQAEAVLLETPNVITLRLATVFGMSPRMRLDLLVNHFTHEAIINKYLIIFEKDFKRNYVHVRDVADCVVHCIDNADKMVGQPYNVGLESANLSKEELALAIKEHVPEFYIHYSDISSDPDKRNYIVSNEKLRDAGFEAHRSLDEGIEELLKGFRMMSRARFGNV